MAWDITDDAKHASIKRDEKAALALGWRVEYAAWQPDDTYLMILNGGQAGERPVKFELCYRPSPNGTGAWTFFRAAERESGNRSSWMYVRRQFMGLLELWKPTRPRCTCGALDYAICFCGINVRDFLATSPNRRI